jgi:hypothetical protein
MSGVGSAKGFNMGNLGRTVYFQVVENESQQSLLSLMKKSVSDSPYRVAFCI